MSNSHEKPLIELHNVSLAYGKKTILQSVDLKIVPAEHITIIGPNGAGKTSLLKIMLGLIAPDTGKVFKRKPLRIGYTPQRMMVTSLLPISVYDFLRLVKGATFQDIKAVLLETGIESVMYTMVHTLSGGEMQRVLLARALLHNPDVLFLDEPTQNLDMGGQSVFYKLLDQLLKKRRCTVIMVSHDLNFVMSTTHRVICLYHHICCIGEPDQIRQMPQFAETFGKEAAAWLALYQHHHDHHHE